VKLARYVFLIAGVWGIVVLTPFYFLVDISGRRYPAPTEYPGFFFGFIAVALAWQVAFLLIASNPARYRLFMIPAMLEKFGYVATLAMLHSRGRIAFMDAAAGIPDALLGLLFLAAFIRTRAAADS
jgi:hypothetical protein